MDLAFSEMDLVRWFELYTYILYILYTYVLYCIYCIHIYCIHCMYIVTSHMKFSCWYCCNFFQSKSMETFYKKTFPSRSFSSFPSFPSLSLSLFLSFYLILGSGICVLFIAFSLSEKNFFCRSDFESL